MARIWDLSRKKKRRRHWRMSPSIIPYSNLFVHRFAEIPLLHHYLAIHAGMNCTVIRKSSCALEGPRESSITSYIPRAESPSIAGHCVGDAPLVSPLNSCSNSNQQGVGLEREIFYVDFISRWIIRRARSN